MVVLRDARLIDLPRLAAIHHEARAKAMPWLPVLHDEAATRVWLRDHVLAAMTMRVACDGAVLVGYMALDGDLLDQLYVAPGHQDRGVGSALLAEARRLSPSGYSLWVFARNARARRFYERHDLVAVEATDGAANEENEPDVRYEWRGEARRP